MMFSLLYTFCLHFYLINIHIFDYPDSRLSGLFTEVPTSPDNRGSTVLLFIEVVYVFFTCCGFIELDWPINITEYMSKMPKSKDAPS